MKARIKFSKYGSMKFIGHLDVMRYFQKAFRRAGFNIEYSKGYSPHQLISFAAPLGVGLTGDSEYVDIQIKTALSPKTMIDNLNEVMSEGFRIKDFKILSDNSKNAMSIVAAADYMISLKDGYNVFEAYDNKEFYSKFKEFYNQNEILILKKTKKSEKEVNIKPMIYKVDFENAEIFENADIYNNGIKIYMQLATGSVENLKPELVLEAFFNWLSNEFNPFAFQIHRLEVYADMGNENFKKFIPLNDVETVSI